MDGFSKVPKVVRLQHFLRRDRRLVHGRERFGCGWCSRILRPRLFVAGPTPARWLNHRFSGNQAGWLSGFSTTPIMSKTTTDAARVRQVVGRDLEDIIHHRLRGLLLLMDDLPPKTPFLTCFKFAETRPWSGNRYLSMPLELNRGLRWTA